jgi:hypothetical protein
MSQETYNQPNLLMSATKSTQAPAKGDTPKFKEPFLRQKLSEDTQQGQACIQIKTLR